MLMLALQLRNLGYSVVLFEADDYLGGAWQVEDLEGVGRVECACHLLEWYVGGYERLSRLAGIDFVPSDPQPIRVYRDGHRELYASRKGFARSAYYLCRAVLAQAAKVVVHSEPPLSDRLWALWDSLERLRLFARYSLPGLLQFDAVRRPEGGYVTFIDTLVDAVRQSGVKIVFDKVISLDSLSDVTEVKTTGWQVLVKRAFIGDSTVLGDYGGASVSEAKKYYHIVIGLPPWQVIERNHYIHLPDDPLFHRITYIDDRFIDGAEKALFLVQLRVSPDEAGDINQELIGVLERCGIAVGVQRPIIHAAMTRQFMQRRGGTRKSRRRRDNRIVHLQTVGDLAYCIMMERTTFGGLRYLLPKSSP